MNRARHSKNRHALLAALALSTALLAARPDGALADDIHRLPTDVVPTFQSIRLDLDPDSANYAGVVRVNLRVTKSTKAVLFHAQDMTLTRVVLHAKRGPMTLHATPGVEGMVTATAPSVIAPGTYTLEIAFTNDFDRRSTGLYRLQTGGRYYAFTQLEAVDARTAFPCWDEPSFKFPYQVTLVVPKTDEAVSNTPIERTTVSGAKKTVVFRRTRPLPSYLLAMAAGPLEFVPVPGTSIPTRVVTVKGASKWASTAVEMTPPLLAALEKYFGSPYPYEKLDLIAIPEFTYGAMENPGAITFGDRFLLFDPKTESVAQRRLYAVFVTHEMSHIWFGDLVTMKWWDDLWLNESFATWMGDKIADQVYPDLLIEVGSMASVQRAMGVDAMLSTRAMRQPITSMDNLLQSADELAYDKGACVLGMFEQWMGAETFRQGVLAYLKAHAWGNAEAADLWAALSQASGRDVAVPMSTFLDQPGVPLVAADILPNGSIRLTQRRFLNFGAEAPSRQLWKIPVRYKYFDGDKVRVGSTLLADSQATVTPEGGRPPVWVHPNADESGYYRWEVGPENAQRLTDASQKSLTTRERIGFIDNAGALLVAGVLHGDDYLRLVEAFASDSEPAVVGSLPGALARVKNAFITPDLEGEFATYVRRVLGPSLRRYGFDRAPGEAEDVSILRPQLIDWMADDGQDPDALAKAEGLARSFRGDRASVDPSLVDAVVRLSALRGDSTLFDQYRKSFEESTVPTDRTTYLQALGSFRNADLRDRALGYTLSASVRPHEALTIPGVMAGTIDYEEQVFEWMTSNYAAIVAKIPPVYAAYMPYLGAGCLETRLEKQKAFFADAAHQAPGTAIELRKLVERTSDCIGLRAREGPAVDRYLSNLAAAR